MGISWEQQGEGGTRVDHHFGFWKVGRHRILDAGVVIYVTEGHGDEGAAVDKSPRRWWALPLMADDQP